MKLIMTPEEATLQLNQEYAHHAYLLGKKKAIVEPDKTKGLLEFELEIMTVSFQLLQEFYGFAMLSTVLNVHIKV